MLMVEETAFHAAPPVIRSRVFAGVPDNSRARENVRMQSGATRDCVLDRPSFDCAGTIWSARLEVAGKTMYSHM